MEKLYLIKTYGCQMNIHESEKLAGVLKELGYSETEDEEKADVIVFNTCCIRESAEQRIYGNIGALKGVKKRHPGLVIAVCGCMAQEKGTAENIKKKFPFVNIVFGTHNLHEFKKYLSDYNKSKKNIYDIWNSEGSIDESMPSFRTSGQNAWVNISYGCNNFCTYCIVPYVRGRERSRDFNTIVNEVKQLINNGYKYITLLGQNVNSYGNDVDDKDVDFAHLLDVLSKLEGNFKIKFMTSHPKDLSDAVIDVIAHSNKISHAIHLPCQSGSTEILDKMNRRYTREQYIALIDKIKSKIPDVSLTSDFIVGFPGETENDFEDTCSLVKYVRYNSIFAFMYSRRRGTIAEKMDNQVPIEIKRKRVNKLLEISREITKEINNSLVGTTQNVLIKGIIKPNVYLGVTDNGKTVEVLTDEELMDDFYDVVITRVLSNKLQSKLKKDI